MGAHVAGPTVRRALSILFKLVGRPAGQSARLRHTVLAPRIFYPLKNKIFFKGVKFNPFLRLGKKNNPQKLRFRGNIYHFRVFYLERFVPEPKESSNIMEIGFKLAKIEYF